MKKNSTPLDRACYLYIMDVGVREDKIERNFVT